MSDLTDLLDGESPEIVPTTRIEKYLAAAIDGSGIEGLPAPVSNVDYLLLQLINVLSGGGGASGGLKCLKYESTATPTGGGTVTFPVDFVMPQNWKMIVVQFGHLVVGTDYKSSVVFTSETLQAGSSFYDYWYNFELQQLPSDAAMSLVLDVVRESIIGGGESLEPSFNASPGYTVTVFYED